MVREMTDTLRRLVAAVEAHQDKEALKLAKQYAKLDKEYSHRN